MSHALIHAAKAGHTVLDLVGCTPMVQLNRGGTFWSSSLRIQTPATKPPKQDAPQGIDKSKLDP